MIESYSGVHDLAKEAGFQSSSIIGIAELLNILKINVPSNIFDSVRSEIAFFFGEECFEDSDRFSILVCGLSCFREEPVDPESIESWFPDETQALSENRTVTGLIAPFARRNYYREAVTRLKSVYKLITARSSFTKDSMKIFCNSHISEKLIAWASGLGNYGKNSLIIDKELGTEFVIAGMLLPFVDKNKEPELRERGAVCGLCEACIDACPTHAIGKHGAIDLERCIQALASKRITIPDQISDSWGSTIYGCEKCQDACPYNRNLKHRTETKSGDIGPAIPLAELLISTPEQIRSRFKKTAIDRSWIDAIAIKRNALIAAANRGNPSLLRVIEPLAADEDPVLRQTALWAINKIMKKKAFPPD
jgi:epoxyqueuosine reductase